MLAWSAGNLIMGPSNPQGADVRAGFFDQPVHSVSITQVVDVWLKHGLHREAADRGLDMARFELADVLREITFAVRSAWEALVREQNEFRLAQSSRAGYDETVRLSKARLQAGEIADVEFKKISLERLKYLNAELDASMQLDLARRHLCALMGLGPETASRLVASEPDMPRSPPELDAMLAAAFEQRPDLAAAKMGERRAEASLRAERRDAFPDIALGLSYTHSYFTVSGDNPNTVGVFVAVPVPIFDRNQGGIGHASVDARAADNTRQKLELSIRHEVGAALRGVERSKALLEIYEGEMLASAENALTVAEKSYKAGAVSLLELLEAQRTYIETRSTYLQTVFDYRQGLVDASHAVGGVLP